MKNFQEEKVKIFPIWNGYHINNDFLDFSSICDKNITDLIIVGRIAYPKMD